MQAKIGNSTIIILSMFLLVACGGGSSGDSSSSGSSSSSSGGSSTNTATGYVLDGNVGSTAVCFDSNFDNQCTSADTYSTTTDSEGYFEIEYTEEIMEYTMISDVRYDTATDSDYEAGSPNYDYVMKAFDQSNRDDIIISPLSTYMQHQKETTNKTNSQISQEVVSTIDQYETYEYSSEVEVSYEYTELIQQNFITNKESNDGHVSDYSERLHNINEVLAREMQEAQYGWDSGFFDNNLTANGETDWSTSSGSLVSNANNNVFESFEIIVEEVTSYNYSSFSAAEVSSTLEQQIPSAQSMQQLFTYMDAKESAANELSGQIIKLNYSSLGYNAYYVFNNNSVTVYSDLGGDCVEMTIPIQWPTGFTAQEFADQLNEFGTAQGVYATVVNSAPTDCSSYADILNGFDVQDSASSADEGTIVDFTPTAQPDLSQFSGGAVMATHVKPEPVGVLTSSNTTGATLNLDRPPGCIK